METLKPLSSTSPRPTKKTGCMKYFLSVLLIIIVIGGGFFYWKFFYTYSEGYRTGLLQKLSHKGNMIKTWEGELVLSSVVSSANVALASEKFYFSVASDSVANVMQRYEGRTVRLHYQQKKSPLFWRGDSEYIVDGIDLENAAPAYQVPAQQQPAPAASPAQLPPPEALPQQPLPQQPVRQ